MSNRPISIYSNRRVIYRCTIAIMCGTAVCAAAAMATYSTIVWGLATWKLGIEDSDRRAHEEARAAQATADGAVANEKDIAKTLVDIQKDIAALNAKVEVVLSQQHREKP